MLAARPISSGPDNTGPNILVDDTLTYEMDNGLLNYVKDSKHARISVGNQGRPSLRTSYYTILYMISAFPTTCYKALKFPKNILVQSQLQSPMTETYAPSNMLQSAILPGSITSSAERSTCGKYSQLIHDTCQPVALETTGVMEPLTVLHRHFCLSLLPGS